MPVVWLDDHEKKNYFFSDSGKALQLKRIILRVCEIEVSGRDELSKFCCRRCHDRVLRLNKNLEIFASTCQSTLPFPWPWEIWVRDYGASQFIWVTKRVFILAEIRIQIVNNSCNTCSFTPKEFGLYYFKEPSHLWN